MQIFGFDQTITSDEFHDLVLAVALDQSRSKPRKARAP